MAGPVWRVDQADRSIQADKVKVELDAAPLLAAAVRAELRPREYVTLAVVGRGPAPPPALQARLKRPVAWEPLVYCIEVEEKVGAITRCIGCPMAGPRPLSCGAHALRRR